MWNTGTWNEEQGVEEEGATTGRLGRFNRKFEGIGGAGGDVDWMEGVGGSKEGSLRAGVSADLPADFKGGRAKTKTKTNTK
jgi:hypothetical protein